MSELPGAFVRTERQPVQRDVSMADGIGVRQIELPEGVFVPQHSHRYDHTTMLAVGRMRVWQEDVFLGEFTAPHALRIPALAKHMMQAVGGDALFYCIHNVSRTGAPEEHEQHHIVCDGDCGWCSL